MTREVIKDQENILLIAKRSVSPSCTVYLVTINAFLQLKASDKPTSLSFIFVTATTFVNSTTSETEEEKIQVWRCISDPVHTDVTELAFYTACPTQKEGTVTH